MKGTNFFSDKMSGYFYFLYFFCLRLFNSTLLLDGVIYQSMPSPTYENWVILD